MKFHDLWDTAACVRHYISTLHTLHHRKVRGVIVIVTQLLSCRLNFVLKEKQVGCPFHLFLFTSSSSFLLYCGLASMTIITHSHNEVKPKHYDSSTIIHIQTFTTTCYCHFTAFIDKNCNQQLVTNFSTNGIPHLIGTLLSQVCTAQPVRLLDTDNLKSGMRDLFSLSDLKLASVPLNYKLPEQLICTSKCHTDTYILYMYVISHIYV